MISYTELKCPGCGIDFEKETKYVKYIKKQNPNYRFFCSNVCYKETIKATKVKGECLNCKKIFEKDSGEANRDGLKFCSHSCSAQYNNTQRKLNGYSQKGKVKTVLCSVCNKECIVPLPVSVK